MTLDLSKIKSDAEAIAANSDLLLMALPVKDVLGLLAEIEVLRKDAERYRWLKDKAHTADWEFIGGQTPDAGEAEIDACMAKEKA